MSVLLLLFFLDVACSLDCSFCGPNGRYYTFVQPCRDCRIPDNPFKLTSEGGTCTLNTPITCPDDCDDKRGCLTGIDTTEEPDQPGPGDLNEIFAGTYEFEVMGRPHRLYICDSDRMADNKHALYWSVADRTANEYAVAVGRDYNGVQQDEDGVFVSRCDIFKLYGDKILKGYYEIIFDATELVFSLRERFPELENGQADDEIWNEYELVKLSPAIVGNPDLEGYQCMHPLGNVVYSMELPSLWESDFNKLDDGYYYTLIEEDALTSCWKLENEFGDVMQAGWHYGYDFEWDGELLLFRFDSVNKNQGCSVGTLFIIVIDEGLAIISRQCEDRVTGRTYIAHAQDMIKHEMCPYEITPFDQAKEPVEHGRR